MNNKIRKEIKWFLVCIIVFLISIFLHEIGHGFANALRGVECSTGFNRVGDIDKYPSDIDFREKYDMVSDSLFDFGVPITLILAIAATLLFCNTKNKRIKKIALPFAVTNSILRLLPCLWVILTPLLTGNVHIEDEYETGVVLAGLSGMQWLIYVPALFSVTISVICIIVIIINIKKIIPIKTICSYGLILILSFGITMIIANNLDNIFRINWHAL
jgi:hypothetical protein